MRVRAVLARRGNVLKWRHGDPVALTPCQRRAIDEITTATLASVIAVAGGRHLLAQRLSIRSDEPRSPLPAGEAAWDVCMRARRICIAPAARLLCMSAHARDVPRSLAATEGYARSRHERKKIEVRFAHRKRILKLGRLRLRVHQAPRTNCSLPSPRTPDSSHRWLRDRPLRLFVYCVAQKLRKSVRV